MKPEFPALNPAGLVPVLIDGGYVVAESRIINGYLEDAYREPRLSPEGAYARARITSRPAHASAMPPAGSEGGQPATA